MNSVRRLIERRFPRGGLKRSVSIIAGGTALAQAIAIAVTPIVTRLYQVEDFGYLQVFNSIVAVLLVVVAGRYETAVPLPEDDDSAVNLTAFAFCIVIAVCTLTGLSIFVAIHIPWIISRSGKLLGYLWLLPLCLAGAGFYQIFNFWSLRRKDYALVARTRVIQVSTRFLMQLGAGALGFGMPGLLVSETVARANGVGSFFQGIRSRHWHLVSQIRPKKMREMALRYKRFPLVFSFSGILNSATLAFPTLLLATFFGATVTGWFALVSRVLGLPTVLIGQSLQQVYLSEGAPLIHENPVALRHLFEKMIRKIYFIPLITCTFLAIFGPAAFSFAFGAKWREAGEYARILAFVDVVGMLVAPIEMTLTMLQLLNWRFAWDCGRLILVVTAMLGVHYFFAGPKPVIYAYAGSMIIGYAVLLIMSYRGINRLIVARMVDAN